MEISRGSYIYKDVDWNGKPFPVNPNNAANVNLQKDKKIKVLTESA